MKQDNLQAIVFDFDGVLVESADIKTQAFAELYTARGEDIAAAMVAYHRANAGVSRYVKFRYCQETLLNLPPLTDSEERELDRRFSALVLQKVVDAPAVAGVEEFLQRRLDRTPMFVASGTPRRELATIIEARGMQHYFRGIFGAPQSKQESIAAILGEYAYDPRKVLMIGDAMSDYEGAAANGTLFLGRVAAGEDNPFPPHVNIVTDLRDIDNVIADL